MKKIARLVVCLFLMFGLAYVPVAGSSPLVLVAEAATVKLNKTSATIYAGTTLKLKVTGTSKKASWSTSKKSVATVDSSGNVTAKKAGNATIKVKVAGKTLSCKVTVKAAPKLNTTKKTVYVGDKIQLKVEGYKIGTVKWTSSDKDVATVKDGKVTTKKAGTVTIKAKVGGKTLSCKITVKKVPELNTTKKTVYVGDKVQLEVNGYKIGTVKWTSSDQDVATVKDGKVTTKKAGTATIKAKVGGKTLSCKVIVKAAPKLSTTKKTLYVGDKFQLNVNGYKIGTVKWTSSNKSAATVNSSGKVTAKDVGTATIKAKVGSKTLSCKIIVKEAPIVVSAVNLDQDVVHMSTGDTTTLVATVSPANATDKSVTWFSDDSSVAKVDENGKVTAIGPGNTMIWANSGDKSAYCVVNVEASDSETEDPSIDETVLENRASLKNYIDIYGSTNADGDKVVAEMMIDDGSVVAGIVHQNAYNNLCFVANIVMDDTESIIIMELEIDEVGNVEPAVLFIYGDYEVAFESHTTFAPEDYDGAQELAFTMDTYLGEISDSEMQELSNVLLQLAFVSWDSLLYYDFNMGLADIGFSAYSIE